jgi:hypothetical protein
VVPGVAGGMAATIQMVAWHKSLGNDFEVARSLGMGGWGESTVLAGA